MNIHRPPGASLRLVLMIILLVLLPVLFLSAYQIGTYSSSEQMMRDLYQRQLEVMLYSLNQYAWDVSAHWASSLRMFLNDTGLKPESGMRTFLDRTTTVESVVMADSGGEHLVLVTRNADGIAVHAIRESLMVRFRSESSRLEQLLRYRSLDYRKLEPFVLGTSGNGDSRIALIFANDSGGILPQYAGLIFKEDEFITRTLAGRLTEAAGQEFVLAVFRKGQDSALVTSGSMRNEAVMQRRDLWLFPDHEIVIASRGATLDEIVRTRLVRNVALVGVLNILLLTGVILIYRNVRAQSELARAKSTFVSNVSHELRTPLALIRMFAETLEMGRLKEEAKKQEYYRTILRETERLTHLVNNLLNFSRMEAGRKPYTLARGSLREVVAEVASTYGPHLEYEGFTPRIELPDDRLEIALDREAVAEAVLNLLDNAAKYGKERKFLQVSAGREGRTAYVEVVDHGIGIPVQYHAKVFEAFFRVPSGYVHDTKGSGLGLSLVKHIMDAHDGQIILKSVPGEGTTVRLVFPVPET
jgi:two-component system phosphate regulon sensor histidine kinase PhoR